MKLLTVLAGSLMALTFSLPMTTVAKGRWTSAPAPVEMAIGTKPSEATNAVISLGRRRVRVPSTTASRTLFPSSRS